MAYTDLQRDELLADAGMALGRGDWAGARALYEGMLDEGADPAVLEGLALASWWQDDITTAIDARERAYAIRRERGETIEAARDAGFLAWDYGAVRGSNAVANGWLQRARRLVADLPPSAEHAWLPLIEASFHLDTNAAAVLRLATEALEQARTHGALDIEMTARTLRGLALVSLGEMAEGMALLDEGTAAATAGELHDPIAIGSCCCNMIIACERARDFERAAQWCAQLAAFCERTSQRPLLALCRAHHGTVLTMRGEWGDAERELDWASGELSTLRPPLAGYARARFAQLRRLQGRLPEARTLLSQAEDHVLAPLVHAELALDDGDASAAVSYAERYLRRLAGAHPIESASAFELLVAARTRLGDTREARAAHARLAEIAAAVGTDSVRAAERAAAAEIALSGNDPATAVRALEDSVDLHRRAGAPYDVARAELSLARTRASDGSAAAALEGAIRAADTFEALGATRAARDAARLVAELGGRRSGAKRSGLTRRELEVLRAVAEGLSNPQIAERLVISEHTVHRHLANVYVKLEVSSRAAAVATAAGHDLLA